MISFKDFNSFPADVKKKVINMVFNANIESELEKIEHSILTEGNKSEYIGTLLENIKEYNKGPFGIFYEVNALICISPSEMDFDYEEDYS